MRDERYYEIAVRALQSLEAGGPVRTLFGLPFLEVWYATKDQWYDQEDNRLYWDWMRFSGGPWHTIVRLGYIRALLVLPRSWPQALAVLERY